MTREGSPSQDFDVFVEETFKLYFRKALFDTKNRQDAEDVVQDAYLKIWSRWPLERVKNKRGYGYKVLKNTIATHFRELNRTPGGRPGGGPEAVAISTRRVPSGVRVCLDALPAVEREVVWLRYFEELSFAEIADLLGLRRKTVHNYHSKAKGALRAMLVRLIGV